MRIFSCIIGCPSNNMACGHTYNRMEIYFYLSRGNGVLQQREPFLSLHNIELSTVMAGLI